jgi:hypothetical protein
MTEVTTYSLIDGRKVSTEIKTELSAKVAERKKLNKKIKFIVYSEQEFSIDKIKERDVNPLLIWSK